MVGHGYLRQDPAVACRDFDTSQVPGHIWTGAGVQDGSPHASEFGLFTELDDETFQGGSSAYSAPTCSVGVNKVILGDIICLLYTSRR